MKPDYVYKDGDFKVIKEMGFKGKPVFIVTELIRRPGSPRRFQFHYIEDMKSSLEDAIMFIEEMKREISEAKNNA